MMRGKLFTLRTLSLLALTACFTMPSSSQGEDVIPILEPVRIALTADQMLLVSDYQAQAIHFLDSSGQNTITSFHVSGHPISVAYDGKRIYVGNRTTASIEVYNRQGKFLQNLGKHENLVALPNDIEINPETGLLYVIDSHDKVVKVFDRKGQVKSFPPSDADKDEVLHNPTALYLDLTQQRVLVSDQGPMDGSFFGKRDAKVQIYDLDGKYLDTFFGTFSRPQGLCLNKDGLLFIADGVLGEILVFDLEGDGKNPIKIFSDFQLPLDVAINPRTQDLFVTNSRAGSIVTLPKGGVIP